MPKSAGQCSVPCAGSAFPTARQNWPNSARTRAGLVWVMLSAPIRVGSTRCMLRCTVTDVAWSTRPQPTAAAAGGTADDDTDDVVEPDDEAGAAAGEEAVTEPHPASAEHNSTASTVPRTWREDIMHL
jgi:hypothetical protein